MGKIGNYFKKNLEWVSLIGAVTYVSFAASINMTNSLAGPYASYNSKSEVEYDESKTVASFSGPSKIVEYLTRNHSYAVKPFTLPFSALGMVDYDKRKMMGLNILDNEGIYEDNPDDNGKRYKLYRELGVAVREGKDERVMVPLKAMMEYLNENMEEYSSFWDSYDSVGWLGDLYFKMDSEECGGDENGVVDDSEWDNALRDIGYGIEEEGTGDIANRPECPLDLSGRDRIKMILYYDNALGKQQEK